MSQYWVLAAILLPVIGGILIPLLPMKKRNHLLLYIETIVLLTSVSVVLLLFNGTTETLYLIRFVNDISISFKVDGMSMVFAGLVAVLWPLATLYAFEYMEHKNNEKSFFMFFTITYGVTLGISFAADMVTMYFFYELLTLITLPLVMHTLTREAIHASRTYLYFSIGGAAFALISIIIFIIYGESCQFTLGGVMSADVLQKHENMLLWVYLLSFMGYGVKSAIWPLSSWLPKAGVAHTPVTALLHAVAVVNAGAFGIIRLTYYCFGVDFLAGKWVQYVVMAIAMFTIVYGCSRAVKETHIKRRLAWSTVGNLSYIIFGATLMSPLGLVGALAHFVFHGFMKMCSFLCAGAFMLKTGKKRIYDMDGLGRRMKVTFACFAVSACGLMGVPGFSGFISKWALTEAAVESGNVAGYIGIACLLVSAMLTAIYMLNIVIRAYFPKSGFDYGTVSKIRDPGWQMCVPMIICAVVTVLLGIFSEPLMEFFSAVAAGLY